MRHGRPLLAVLMAGLPALAACGGSEPTAPQSTPVAIATVVVTPSSDTLLALGQTRQFNAEAKDAAGNTISGRPITWSSTNASVATVNASGLATAVSTGNATIRATVGGRSGSALLAVRQEPSAISVTPAADTLTAFGATIQLAAAAEDATGHTIAGPAITWSSSDDNVALVSPSGLVTATGNGSADIIAAGGAVSDTAAIEVFQSVISVEVSPTILNLAVGESAPMTAVVMDSGGSEVLRPRSVTWQSEDSTVATVSADGVVTAAAPGTARIRVECETLESLGFVSVWVTNAAVARLTMPDTVTAGAQLEATVILDTRGVSHRAGALDASVTFDPAFLQFSTVAVDTIPFVSGYYDNVSGFVRFVTSEPQGIAGELSVLTITFDVIATPGAKGTLAVGVNRFIAAGTFADATASTVALGRSYVVR